MTGLGQQITAPDEILHDQPVRGPFGEHESLASKRECGAMTRVVVGVPSDSPSTEGVIVRILAQSSDAQDQEKGIDEPIYGVCGQISGALSWKPGWDLNQLREITIGDKVREVCDRCFFNCGSIRRIIFGPSSSLERIGIEAFAGDPQNACQIEEISIPNGVRELCDRCFFNCCQLRRITFGTSSSLERIGVEAFSGDYVELTCSLEEVIFGMLAANDTDHRAVIGDANNACQIAEISIPDGVRELCDRCFYNCVSLHRVTFGESSSLERIGVDAFSGHTAKTACHIEEVSIPDGVRELCDQCFYGCHSLQRVTFGLSSSLVRIGVKAFSGFTSDSTCQIEEISIPDGVREICDQCFYNCSCLRHITFGALSSLERIGVAAFSGYTAETACHIEEVSIPDGVRELCDRTFCNCTSLRRVTFRPSSSLERIGSQCFGLSGLAQFEMPNSVSFVGGAAFGECTTSDHFHCSDDCNFSTVDGLVLDRSLMSCYCSIGALSSILIPDHVHYLHDRCFYGCRSLQRVTFGPSSSLEWIGEEAFAGDIDNACAIAEIHIPDEVRDLGDRCFYNCMRLHRITFGPFSSLERIGVEAFSGYLYNNYDQQFCFACQIEEINIPDGVRELCDRCFYQCYNLRVITFGPSSSLQRIGVEAFSGQSDDDQYEGFCYACQLTEIRIPDSVCDIGQKCFYDCTNLHSVTFGVSSSLERIGEEACAGYTPQLACHLEEIIIPGGLCELCDRTFYNCVSLRHITFGSVSSLERIGVATFSGYQFDDDDEYSGCACGCSITEISIPDSVRELCDRCFHACHSLRTVTFGPSSSLERIGSQCFESTNLEQFEMPKLVSFVGSAAFGAGLASEHFCCSDDCHVTMIDGVVFDRGLISCYCCIGAVSSIVVPDSVRYLHDRCLYGCYNLRIITFGPLSSLERIGKGAFSGYNATCACQIEEIHIPDGVRELDDSCFYNCQNLARVTFGSLSLLERIGVGAFSGDNNDDNGFMNQECILIEPEFFNACHIEEIRIPDSVRELCDGCFYGCKSLHVLTFGPASSLERIGFNAFYHTALEQE